MTGIDELTGSGGGGAGVLALTLIGAIGAIAILAFVFGSFIALLPLIMALVSILTTFLLVDGLTLAVDVSFLVQFLVALIGLGVAIDYSLLVVTRWREERAPRPRTIAPRSKPPCRPPAARCSTPVSPSPIGLFALIVLPVPFLRSVGYGGVLIPLVSVLVSLTLLPALLTSGRPVPRPAPPTTAGRRITRVDRVGAPGGPPPVDSPRLVGLAVLIALVVPAFSLVARRAELGVAGHLRPPRARPLDRLERAAIASGALTPIQVLTDARPDRPGHRRAPAPCPACAARC